MNLPERIQTRRSGFATAVPTKSGTEASTSRYFQRGVRTQTTRYNWWSQQFERLLGLVLSVWSGPFASSSGAKCFAAVLALTQEHVGPRLRGHPRLASLYCQNKYWRTWGAGLRLTCEPFAGLTVRNHPASRSYSRLHASILRCYPTHAHAACPYGPLHSNTCVGCEGMGLSASLTFQFHSTDGS